MTSEVSICNLALAYLGDSATVSSINPPEGSAQADHCARFYPIARNSLLEMHAWGFSTKRITLALLGSGAPAWEYSYMQPSDALNIIAVLPPDAIDDYSQVAPNNNTSDMSAYSPQAFSCEIDGSGNAVILTDQEDAVLRYTSVVDDPTKFSPLFVLALSWHLAAMLAGPLIKGSEGAAEAKRCMSMMQLYLSRATQSDASQRQITPTHTVNWLAARL